MNVLSPIFQIIPKDLTDALRKITNKQNKTKTRNPKYQIVCSQSDNSSPTSFNTSINSF